VTRDDELAQRIRDLQAERLRPRVPPPPQAVGATWAAVLRRRALAEAVEGDEDED